MFYPITRSQGKHIISATKAMIETHVMETAIRIIPERYFQILQTDSITQWKQCQI